MALGVQLLISRSVEPSSRKRRQIRRTSLASVQFTTSLRSWRSYPSGRRPPIHMPLARDAANLSRIRSPITSRSNWADESRMLSVSRPEPLSSLQRFWRGWQTHLAAAASPISGSARISRTHRTVPFPCEVLTKLRAPMGGAPKAFRNPPRTSVRRSRRNPRSKMDNQRLLKPLVCGMAVHDRSSGWQAGSLAVTSKDTPAPTRDGRRTDCGCPATRR